MTVAKTLYTLGDVDARAVIGKMKRGERGWEYFVYITDGAKLNIGTFQAVMSEHDAVVFGIATSRRLVKKLAVHIVTKAFELDSDIESGIIKLAGNL